MSGSRGKGGTAAGWGVAVSDLIRSRQSRQAECGHVGALLAERGGSEDGRTLVWSSLTDQTDSKSDLFLSITVKTYNLNYLSYFTYSK